MKNENQNQANAFKPSQAQIVKTTWSLVTPMAAEVGPLFYGRLFEIAPETKSLFMRTTIPEQSKKLLAMMSYVISNLDKIETLVDEVNALALRHVQYGVKAEHYEKVGQALLWTLEQGLGTAWTNAAREAWTNCYLLLSGVMIQAADRKMVA